MKFPEGVANTNLGEEEAVGGQGWYRLKECWTDRQTDGRHAIAIVHRAVKTLLVVGGCLDIGMLSVFALLVLRGFCHLSLAFYLALWCMHLSCINFLKKYNVAVAVKKTKAPGFLSTLSD